MTRIRQFFACPVHGAITSEHVDRNGQGQHICYVLAPNGLRCRQLVSVRRVEHTQHPNGFTTKCGPRCTSGKTHCDCKCGGLCHGLGKCVCGQVAA
jgi:hypothetical protein